MTLLYHVETIFQKLPVYYSSWISKRVNVLVTEGSEFLI
jgi:hypothetical protein